MRRLIFDHFVCAAVWFLVFPTGVSGQRLFFGAIGGTNLTHDFHTFRTDYLDTSYPNGLSTFLLYSDSHSFIVGPMMEVPLLKDFSVEVNALHRTLQLKRLFITPAGQRIDEGSSAIGTWEFPLLLKYKLPMPKVRPFIEMGPSFRLRKNPSSSDPSPYGGMEVFRKKIPLRACCRRSSHKWPRAQFTSG